MGIGLKLMQKVFRRERYVRTNVRPDSGAALDRYDKIFLNEEKLDASNKAERVMRKVARRLNRAFGFSAEAHKPPLSTRQKVSVARVVYAGNTSGYGIEITFPVALLDYEGFALSDVVVFLNGTLKGLNLAVVNIPDSTHLILEDSTLGSTLAVAASFTGQVAGMTSNVTITANNAGTIGNSVTLSFNGTTDINTAIANWNTANPTNMITLTSGIGTQTPSNATSISLSGGVAYAAYSAANITTRILINGDKRSYV